jgi:glycosyltransferase involved in cell wall biosynthesis
MTKLLSVLIPSRNEPFLSQTIEDILVKATEEIEVIVVLDGYWPSPLLKEHKNLTLIHRSEPHGMRDGINSAVSVSRGSFLLKCDAHCMFEQGFDAFLKSECDENWVVIPRRYSLDAENWCIKKDRPFIDAHFLSYPYAKPQEIGMHGDVWPDRTKSRKDILLDDEMSSQGSCWFMHKSHFQNRLKGLSEVGYGRFVQEFQEIGLKTWLGGGRCVINKKTYYAHLHKGKAMGRGYYISQKEMVNGAIYSADFWMNNRWEERKHDLVWLIERFWPVPTWPENYHDLFNLKK